MSWKSGAFGAFAVGLFSVSAFAAWAQSANQPAESPIHAVARFAGIAATAPPPADFVIESRPATPQSYLPIFRPYEEPASKVKTGVDLKAMGADLQKTGENADKLRTEPDAAAAADPAPAKPVKAAKKTSAAKPTPSPSSEN